VPKSRDLNIDRELSDVVAQIRRPKLEPETGWWKVTDSGTPVEDLPADEQREIFFEGSWGNVGDGLGDGFTYAPVSWHQSHHGEVRHRGVIDGGDVGDLMFVLPEEDRIEFTQVFACSIIGGGVANVRVDPDGSVTLESVIT
jgi:hypothetical protein